MKEIMVKKLMLDREEMIVRRTWGTEWRRMLGDRKRHGMIGILTGEWRGRTVHVQYVPFEHIDMIKLKRIVFMDGTTLEISIWLRTLEQILSMKIEKRDGYGSLIKDARATREETYVVKPQKAFGMDVIVTPQMPEGKAILVETTPKNESAEEVKEIVEEAKPWWVEKD